MTHTVLTTNDLPQMGAIPAIKGDTVQLQDGSIFIFHPETGWNYGNVLGISNPLTGGIVFIGQDGRPMFVDAYSPEEVSSVIDVPSTISGLALWLDASDPLYTAGYASQCSSSSDTVSIWPDKSGNGAVATPVGSPKYSPTGHNGKPAVAFNGNSHFTIPSVLTAAFDGGFTLFVVASRSDSSGNFVSVGTTGTKNLYAQRDMSSKTAALSANGPVGASGSVKIINQAFVEMYAYDGASCLVWADAFCRAESALSQSQVSGAMTAAATGATGVSGQTIGIGALSDGSYRWPGTISEVLLFSGAISADDQKRVLRYLSKKWGVPGVRPVTCVGDSLTSGTGSSGGALQAVSPSGNNYPCQLWAALGQAGYSVRIDAYPGRTLAQIASEAQLGTYVGCTEYGQPITVVWAGTNSLTIGKSSGAAINALQKICLGYKRSGHKVVVMTCLPRGDAVYSGFENDRSVYNQFIKASYKNFSDAVVDVAGDARLQNPNDGVNFAADKIHLTDAGYAVVAVLVRPVVAGL